MAYQLKTTSKFNRIKKKLPASLQKTIDQQVLLICQHPETGEIKTGDLAGVRVHKFGHMGQLYLLAYEADEQAEVMYIYAVGGRENFYRDLKTYLKS